MASPSSVNITSWTKQSSTPIYDGSYPFSTRPSSGGEGNIIASDDFTSGALSAVFSGSNRVTITSETVGGRPTSNVANFLFPAAAAGSDSIAELRFDLGAVYGSVGIVFDLYIPTNFAHRNESPSNNKFFRMWTNTYNDAEKVGSSMMYNNGFSDVGPDYRLLATNGISTGVLGVRGSLITASDLGTWMQIKINVRAPTGAVGTANGLLEIKKNNVVVFSHPLDNNFDATNGYRYGYLLGHANSGYAQDTRILIDNVQFFDEVQ